MTKKLIKLAVCLTLVLGPAAFAQDDAAADEPQVQKTTLMQMIKVLRPASRRAHGGCVRSRPGAVLYDRGD